jgi:phosphotransferase family enzyme
LTRWVEANLGGRVVRVERIARWRPAWDLDVELAGHLVPLHARGEREANFAVPYRIADEAPIHDLLEAQGLPVPHAYGLCPEPYALVMGRLAGAVDLTFAADDDERRELIEEYLALLPRIYGISEDALRAAGFELGDTAEDVALGSFRDYEREHDRLMPARDPVAEFLRRWLHRNYPRDRATPTFVTFDAFQFMFEGGHITGLLDFELSCIGDPMMDLAALRVRDTIKNLGDLSVIADRYTAATGIPVDHDAVDFHTVLYNTLTVLTAGPPILAPVRTTDHISHQAWYVNSARWAFETIAEIEGFALDPVDEPAPRWSPHRPAFEHLSTSLRARAAEAPDDYEAATLQREARHLARIDSVGAAVLEADQDDLAALLGRRVATEDADAALVEFVDHAGDEHDEALVHLLDRRVQRAHLLLAPPGSLLLRHPRLRHLRSADADVVDEAERWPAGAIPGTR